MSLLVFAAGAGAVTTPVHADPEPEPGSTSPAATTPSAPTPPPAASPEPNVASPPPAQAPLVEWSDAVPPALGFASVRTNLEDARRHGLRVAFRVTEPVTLRADVLIVGDVVDRELRMCALPGAGPGDSLAKTTIARTLPGAGAVRVPFNVPSRRTLKKFLRITLQVRLIAVDQAGNETTAFKTVALRRR